MQKIDKYCSEVYYISTTIADPQTPKSLIDTLRRDLIKMMVIGSVLAVASRYCIQKRYYLFKNYLGSVFWGSLFGVAYSPFFLGPKIDSYKLTSYL